MTAGERDAEDRRALIRLAEELCAALHPSEQADIAADYDEPNPRYAAAAHFACTSAAERLLPWLRDHDAEVRAQAKRDAVGPVVEEVAQRLDALVPSQLDMLRGHEAYRNGVRDAYQHAARVVRAALGEQP